MAGTDPAITANDAGEKSRHCRRFRFMLRCKKGCARAAAFFQQAAPSFLLSLSWTLDI
jgi:hypothetical protein